MRGARPMNSNTPDQLPPKNTRPKQQPIDQQWLIDYLTLPKRKKRSKLTEFFGWVLGF